LEYLAVGNTSCMERISHLVLYLMETIESGQILKSDIESGSELVALLSEAAAENSQFGVIHEEALSRAQRALQTAFSETSGGHFEWKDGVLVQAMIKGNWIHLKNANMCPSSVLDRLNPVLEPGGSLLLAECGATNDEEASVAHRVVRCHPDFRVFLSMNPDYGEVSRAMRNRCVEVSLLERSTLETTRGTLDALDLLWEAGIRSSFLGSSILSTDSFLSISVPVKASVPELSAIPSFGRTVACLLDRGVPGQTSVSKSDRLLFGHEDAKLCVFADSSHVGLQDTSWGSLFCSPSIRAGWSSSPLPTSIVWEARLLRLFIGWGRLLPKSETILPLRLQSFCEVRPSLAENETALLRNHLLLLFLSKARTSDLIERSSFLAAIVDGIARSSSWMSKQIRKTIEIFCDRRSAGEDASPVSAESRLFESFSPMQRVITRRLPQSLKEFSWLQGVLARPGRNRSNTTDLSVLEASFCVAEGLVDRALVECPLTLLLCPFFQAFDGLANSLVGAVRHVAQEEEIVLANCFGTIMLHRDGLWNLLLNQMFSITASGFVGFDETQFIVQWMWLRKSFEKFANATRALSVPLSKEVQLRWEAAIRAIDQVLFQRPFAHLGASLSKHMHRPLTPRQKPQWTALFALREIAESCSLGQEESKNLSASIELRDLVACRHPSLYLDSGVKRDILAALCMSHVVSTQALPRSEKQFPTSISLKAQQAISERVSKVRKAFSSQLDFVSLDPRMDTAESVLSVGEIESIMSQSRSVATAYSKISEGLLTAFARIQLSPIAEFWCEQEEARLISRISRLVVQRHYCGDFLEQIRSLSPSIRAFIDVAVRQTLWSVNDLVPYQTLLYSIEGSRLDGLSIEDLLSGLLPIMFCS